MNPTEVKFQIYRLYYHVLWIADQLFGTQFKLSFAKKRKCIYQTVLLKKYAKIKNSFLPHEVLHITKLNNNNIKKTLLNHPLVFKNIIQKDILDNWTFKKIKASTLGIKQSYADGQNYFFHKGKMDIGQILDNVEKEQPEISLMFGDLLYQKPDLIDKLQLEQWIDLNVFSHALNKTWQVFSSGKNKSTKLHTELGNALSIQLIGKKTWIIFYPKYSMNVMPSINWRMYLESDVCSFIKNFNEQNLSIKAYSIELSPGDVLYCPSFCWHFVFSDEPSFSVAFKWTNLKTIFRHPFLSLIVLTARSPSILSKMPFFKKIGDFHPPPA